MSNNDIAKKISSRRKQLGLTMEQVGQAVGVGKSTVQRWESGQIQNMRRDKIEALANVLQIKPVELVSVSTSSQKHPNVKLRSYKKSLGQTMVRAVVNDPTQRDQVQVAFIGNTNRDPQFNDMMKLWKVATPKNKDRVVKMLEVLNQTEKE